MPLSLLFDAKLPEPTDKHVLSGCKGRFDKLEKGFDQLNGVIELVSVFLGESFNNIVLGKGHWEKSFVFGRVLKPRTIEGVTIERQLTVFKTLLSRASEN